MEGRASNRSKSGVCQEAGKRRLPHLVEQARYDLRQVGLDGGEVSPLCLCVRAEELAGLERHVGVGGGQASEDEVHDAFEMGTEVVRARGDCGGAEAGVQGGKWSLEDLA